MGRLTNLRNTIAASFLSNNVTTAPTPATFNVAGVTTMRVRRVFGSFARGMKNSLVRAAVINANNPAPVAPTFTNQTATEGEAITPYAHPVFTDLIPLGGVLTYSATQSDGSALPEGLVYTASTRTFSGTFTTAGVYTIRVTAVDAFGKSGSGTFTYTVTGA